MMSPKDYLYSNTGVLVTTSAENRDTIAMFREVVRTFWQTGKRDLPWRHTTDPYHILVSEIMLQQTQVPRVIEKYTAFIARFPDFQSLASASLADVLTVWQGLGYNRRALMLKKLAVEVVEHFGGVLPNDEQSLRSLPGIGPYTASAVLAFAFDQPVVLIETNIRSVFIHHFFGDCASVHDRDILPLVEAALDRDHPREWYSALMDYGTVLKSRMDNPSRRSAHHVRQSKFEGSDRQIRGEVLRILVGGGKRSEQSILRDIGIEPERVKSILSRMTTEGLIVKDKRSFCIA